MTGRRSFAEPGPHSVALATEPGPYSVALAGAVALAVAMGIGRFAFTPLLPMMLHDGVIDLHAASWLASANYLGYLAGALLCTFQPWIGARAPWLPAVDGPWLLRAGLVATVLLTLGMALPAAAAWPLLRFAAGGASAVVFVCTSNWCLSQLARRDAAALGGVVFTGPGLGIVVSGLFASGMVQWGWHAPSGWVIFGLLALGLTASVWRTFGSGRAPMPTGTSIGTSGTAAALASPASTPTPRSMPDDAPHGRAEIGLLSVAYGIAGFGYIITATFLPVIARAALPGSPWLDMFWPIFGVGVVAGSMLSSRIGATGDLRLLLAGSYVLQACGIAASLASPDLAGFVIGSLMVGLPLTAITFFAMQEVRRVRPLLASSFMGLLTATYGLGQIVGPLLTAMLLRRSANAGRSAGDGFTLSLELAAGALLVGAALYGWSARAYPVRRH